MKKLALPIHPREATQKALKLLPNSRLREVLERRFGLRSKEAETLESIGQSFGVTRERVRQIEADALKHLGKPEIQETLTPILSALEGHFGQHGHVFEAQKLLATVVEPRFHNHVHFLLTVGKPFELQPEDELWHDRWFTKEESRKAAETILARTADELGEVGKPLSASELFQILKKQAREVLGLIPSPEVLESYLSTSKLIRQNPYGEFGLVSWPTIRPRGIRDKAYAVLAKYSKPMHFREVAGAITKAGWSARKAHPQTVHNELIKDPRFVLVGRGLYALGQWGYEPGTVADVMTAILKSSRRPMSRDEIVKRVLEKRFVKANTILLNLQNKRLFKRTPEGYSLV